MMCVRNDKVVRLLLQAGASADLRDRGGETALMLAANLGGDLNSARGVSAVRLLLSVGRASVDLQDDQGRTALIWAASHAAPLLVHLLLAAGASKDVQDRRGRAALMAAILGQNTSAVGQLLAAGASTTLQDHGGETALFHAVEWEEEESHWADCEDFLPALLAASPAGAASLAGLKSEAGETVLFKAARMGRNRAVKCLLNAAVAASHQVKAPPISQISACPVPALEGIVPLVGERLPPRRGLVACFQKLVMDCFRGPHDVGRNCGGLPSLIKPVLSVSGEAALGCGITEVVHVVPEALPQEVIPLPDALPLEVLLLEAQWSARATCREFLQHIEARRTALHINWLAVEESDRLPQLHALLARMPLLTSIDVSEGNVHNLLAKLLPALPPRLVSLRLNGSGGWIPSLELLRTCCSALHRLELKNCVCVSDFSALEACRALTFLDLNGSYAKDIRALAACSQLTSLSLRKCQVVVDISALAACSLLVSLCLHGCTKVVTSDSSVAVPLSQPLI